MDTNKWRHINVVTLYSQFMKVIFESFNVCHVAKPTPQEIASTICSNAYSLQATSCSHANITEADIARHC